MPDGQVEADDGAVAPADDGGLVDLQRVEQREDVIGHQVVAEWPLVARAAPVTAAIYQHHSVRPRQGACLVAEIIGIGEDGILCGFQ
jgi:hypothetical protein